MAKDKVVKKEEVNLAVYDYGTDAAEAGEVASGFENQTNDDTTVPFLNVLQALSPQVDEDEGVEDARPGMLINTVTNELFDGKDGVEFIPVSTDHYYTEFVPRNQGGGFKGVHPVDSQVISQAMTSRLPGEGLLTEDGNDLTETFVIFGLTVKDNIASYVVVSFASTKIPVYKRLMTVLRMFKVTAPDGRKVSPPLFSHKVLIRTTKVKNNKGEFYNFAITPANKDVASSLVAPNDPLYLEAKAFKSLIEIGKTKVDHSAGAEGKVGNKMTDGFTEEDKDLL